MVKKRISLAFVACAMLITFAHAIVPHHHHDGLVCFQLHHGEGCTCGQDHDFAPSPDCTCHHQHHAGEPCPLTSQVFIQDGIEDFSHYFAMGDHAMHILWGILAENQVAQLPTLLSHSFDGIFPSLLESQYHKSAVPLRAPPFRV